MASVPDVELGEKGASPAAPEIRSSEKEVELSIQNGKVNKEEKPSSSEDPSPSTRAREDTPTEPYMTLNEIAELHPESHVNVENVERSSGLTSAEAADRLAKFGRNVLTPPPTVPEWLRFLKQFLNIFLILLTGCAILSIVAYILFGDITNLYLAIVLIVVVFLTALLQFHEEGKALGVIDSFKTMLATSCVVLRDGKQQTVDVATLVCGDLILIKNGDKVPADAVLLLCRGLKAECSSLTGESEPINCSDNPSKPGTRMFECKNLAFNGSLCFDGMAIGLIVRTGDKTAIGTIAKLASGTQQRESTLQIEVRNFVKLVAVIAVTMASACFVASVFLKNAKTPEDIAQLFVNGFLVILVANVPQGLPSTVVSLLSLAARNMAKRAVLVKRIDCVETLGSCSIICSDKTGTLTKNEMTVTDVWYNQRMVKRYRKETESLAGTEPQALLLRTAALCNRAEPVSDETLNEKNESIRGSQRMRISNVSRLSWKGTVQKSVLTHEGESLLPKFAGNPSDVALLTYCDKMYSVYRIRQDYPILFEVPFNSTNKWQLVIVKSLDDTPDKAAAGAAQDDGGSDDNVKYEVLMKGAPEVILKVCNTYSSTKGASHKVEITEAFRMEFMTTYEGFAAQGRRVLALCATSFYAPKNFVFSSDDDKYNFPTKELNFIGMFAIMDPPRDNVPDAITKCHNAGVKVFMVTGDHPLTARSIARQIGLLKSDNNIELLENETKEIDWNAADGAVIHGCRIDDLTDDQWRCILEKDGGVCFARTTPAHKLQIVEKCQTLMGHIVAVTGDGVNDAPALKQADIGIAMGLKGSAVAQDAADILLMDDNFASIVNGIEEGRIIFDNIKKTIAYTMAHIFPEVVSALLSTVAGLPAGLTAMQVLTIDLGTELGPAISLAYEPSEANIMDVPPRNPKKDRLVSPVLLLYSYVTSGCIISVFCLLAYMFTFKQKDLKLSDFNELQPSDVSDYFSLTASDTVTVPRTGESYTADEQKDIFTEGTTAFYISLTIAQFCHIWSTKTRLMSLFAHGFSNKSTFYGVAFGLCLVLFFCYTPGVQEFVGSNTVGYIPWVTGLGAGITLFIYNEASKWYFRQAKADDFIVRMLAW